MLPRILKVGRSIPAEAALIYYYARGAHGVLPIMVGGAKKSIGSIVSDAIVRRWLWSTATTNSPLG